MLMAMAALAFWMLDTHYAVLARLRAQDTGDPAALAAARWQAAGLNLIGELNLIHAYMLADDVANIEAANALNELQKRIALTTQFLSLKAAQEVAQINGADPLDHAKELLEECRHIIQFPDLYEGATEDFQAMIDIILREKDLYIFPISATLPDAATLLGEQDFYEAILSHDYCWFYFGAYSFLKNYRSHQDFGDVDEISTRFLFDLSVDSSEIPLKTLRMTPYNEENTTLTVDFMNEQMRELGHPEIAPEIIDPAAEGLSPESALIVQEQIIPQSWAVYGDEWVEWTQMRRINLPIRSDVLPEHDVLGAYSVLNIMRNGYPWMSAAKPFGALGGYPPRENDIILGGFDTVRLVPIDALDSDIRPFEYEWFRHIYLHVREYSRNGMTFNGCRYCKALAIWDRETFRTNAIMWLALNGHTCRKRPTGGPGETGGANYAH
jgi:hypothetical protein